MLQNGGGIVPFFRGHVGLGIAKLVRLVSRVEAYGEAHGLECGVGASALKTRPSENIVGFGKVGIFGEHNVKAFHRVREALNSGALFPGMVRGEGEIEAGPGLVRLKVEGGVQFPKSLIGFILLHMRDGQGTMRDQGLGLGIVNQVLKLSYRLLTPFGNSQLHFSNQRLGFWNRNLPGAVANLFHCERQRRFGHRLCSRRWASAFDFLEGGGQRLQ